MMTHLFHVDTLSVSDSASYIIQQAFSIKPQTDAAYKSGLSIPLTGHT